MTPHNRKEAPPGHAATAPLPCWPRRANPDITTHPLGRHPPTQRPNVTALPRRTAVPDATSAPPNQTVPAGQWLPGRGHSPTANRSSADQVHAEFTVQQIRQGLPVLGRRFGRPQIRLGLLDTADDGSGCWSTIRSARRYAARSPRCLPTFRRTSSRQPNCSANSGRLMPGTSRHRPSTGSTLCHPAGGFQRVVHRAPPQPGHRDQSKLRCAPSRVRGLRRRTRPGARVPGIGRRACTFPGRHATREARSAISSEVLNC